MQESPGAVHRQDKRASGQPLEQATKKCRRDETKLRCKAKEQICTTSPCGIYRNTNLSCFQTEVFLTAKGQGFFLFVFNKTRVFVMPTNPDIQFNVRYVPNILWIWTITS